MMDVLGYSDGGAMFDDDDIDDIEVDENCEEVEGGGEDEGEVASAASDIGLASD